MNSPGIADYVVNVFLAYVESKVVLLLSLSFLTTQTQRFRELLDYPFGPSLLRRTRTKNRYETKHELISLHFLLLEGILNVPGSKSSLCIADFGITHPCSNAAIHYEAV